MNGTDPFPRRGHLLRDLPPARPDEVFESLLERDGVRIERITSRGHVTADGEWYDQEHAEWVLILRGAARLEVERPDGRLETLDVEVGAWVDLPARVRHRVAWTDPEGPTVWLAVHWPEEDR